MFEGRVYGVAFGNPASELWGLGPKTLSSGPVFGVLGSMDPVGGTDVMLVVARDGIEPPTPAFSGPRSTD